PRRLPRLRRAAAGRVRLRERRPRRRRDGLLPDRARRAGHGQGYAALARQARLPARGRGRDPSPQAELRGAGHRLQAARPRRAPSPRPGAGSVRERARKRQPLRRALPGGRGLLPRDDPLPRPAGALAADHSPQGFLVLGVALAEQERDRFLRALVAVTVAVAQARERRLGARARLALQVLGAIGQKDQEVLVGLLDDLLPLLEV